MFFNYERLSVILYPFDCKLRIKLCRIGKTTAVTIILIISIIAFWTGNIINTGCGLLFGYQSTTHSLVLNIILSLYWLFGGLAFLFAGIIIEPLLCIVLTIHCRKIIESSKKMQAINKAKISKNIKDIKINLGQIITAIYIIICILPMSGYFAIGFGIHFVKCIVYSKARIKSLSIFVE